MYSRSRSPIFQTSRTISGPRTNGWQPLFKIIWQNYNYFLLLEIFSCWLLSCHILCWFSFVVGLPLSIFCMLLASFSPLLIFRDSGTSSWAPLSFPSHIFSLVNFTWTNNFKHCLLANELNSLSLTLISPGKSHLHPTWKHLKLWHSHYTPVFCCSLIALLIPMSEHLHLVLPWPKVLFPLNFTVSFFLVFSSQFKLISPEKPL